jgi:hypothetical protein
VTGEYRDGCESKAFGRLVIHLANLGPSDILTRVCNFEQSAYFGQCRIRPVRQGSHGLVSIGSIGVQTLTAALYVLSPNAICISYDCY